MVSMVKTCVYSKRRKAMQNPGVCGEWEKSIIGLNVRFS